jgi:hypothetical protein
MPPPDVIRQARQLLAVSPPVHSVNVHPATIHYVQDAGHRHMVAVYEGTDHVITAECARCPGICAHLLIALASCGKFEECANG